VGRGLAANNGGADLREAILTDANLDSTNLAGAKR